MSLSLFLPEPPNWKPGRGKGEMGEGGDGGGELPSEIKAQKAAELTQEEEGRQSRVSASDLDQTRIFQVIPFGG